MNRDEKDLIVIALKPHYHWSSAGGVARTRKEKSYEIGSFLVFPHGTLKDTTDPEWEFAGGSSCVPIDRSDLLIMDTRNFLNSGRKARQ